MKLHAQALKVHTEYFLCIIKIHSINKKILLYILSINIFKSDFDIYDVRYTAISSDAIDIDFGVGSINNLKFENIGNDAIDFSGSKVNLEGIYINGSGDKGIFDRTIVKETHDQKSSQSHLRLRLQILKSYTQEDL